MFHFPDPFLKLAEDHARVERILSDPDITIRYCPIAPKLTYQDLLQACDDIMELGTHPVKLELSESGLEYWQNVWEYWLIDDRRRGFE